MITTIVTFIIILGILVLVHELGHFLTSRLLGIKVDEFGLGLPPRALGVRKSKDRWKWVFGKKTDEDGNTNTIYSINWLPLGGFVKIKGEDGGFEQDEDSFGSKAIWKRVVVLASGVTMNILLAIILLALVFNIGIPTVINDEAVRGGGVTNSFIQVLEILPQSPAEGTNIKMGDKILGAGEASFSTITDLKEYLHGKAGTEISLRVEQEGKQHVIPITPEVLKQNGEVGLGVGLVLTGIVEYPIGSAILKGATETALLVGQILKAFGDAIASVFTTKENPIDVAGPVGIAVLTGEVVNLGFVYVLQFAALLSINLAIINIVPFPALDGGRILFLFMEKLRGRPVNPKVEGLIHNIGLYTLLLLIVWITISDILGIVK